MGVKPVAAVRLVLVLPLAVHSMVAALPAYWPEAAVQPVRRVMVLPVRLVAVLPVVVLPTAARRVAVVRVGVRGRGRGRG